MSEYCKSCAELAENVDRQATEIERLNAALIKKESVVSDQAKVIAVAIKLNNWLRKNGFPVRDNQSDWMEELKPMLTELQEKHKEASDVIDAINFYLADEPDLSEREKEIQEEIWDLWHPERKEAKGAAK